MRASVYYLSFLTVLVTAAAMSIARSKALFTFDALLSPTQYSPATRCFIESGQWLGAVAVPFLLWALYRSFRPADNVDERIFNISLAAFVAFIVLLFSILALALPWTNVVVGLDQQ